MEVFIGGAVEIILDFLDTYLPGFQSFHIWMNSFIDEQTVLYFGVPLAILVVVYFYKKFPYK